MRDLRKMLLAGAAALVESQGVCDLVWQGDLGTGQSTGSGVWSDPGAYPCRLYGPLPATGVSGQGYTYPPFRLGMVINGDLGSEFILGKLVLGSATDLLPGQGYFFDENFTATLLSTVNANNTLNAEVGVLNVWYPQAPAGTYWGWFQRAGRCSVQAAAGSVATGFGETSAGAAGQFKFPATATAGQKSISPSSAFVASSGVQFTGNTVNGSPYISNVVATTGTTLNPLGDLQVGQVITGANLPANAIIAAITRTGNTWQITIGTNTAGSYNVLQNATGTAVGTTFTVTSHVTANLYWPTLIKQN